MYCGHASLCVCLSVAVRPQHCTDPDVTWGCGRGCPLVVHYWADLQSTLVALLWKHNANPSYKLASIPRYDDIVRTAGWAGSARAAGRRPAGDPKTARRIREAGATGPPATGRRRGAFSTLLQQSGLRASTGGVLATKSERKMLASTCLYSLYAWLKLVVGWSLTALLAQWNLMNLMSNLTLTLKMLLKIVPYYTYTKYYAAYFTVKVVCQSISYNVQNSESCGHKKSCKIKPHQAH